MLETLKMPGLEVYKIHAYGKCFPISSRSNRDNDENWNSRYAFTKFFQMLVQEIVIYETEENSH